MHCLDPWRHWSFVRNILLNSESLYWRTDAVQTILERENTGNLCVVTALQGYHDLVLKLDCWTHALRFLNFFWMHVTNCFFLFNASCWFGVKRKMFHATDEEIPQRKGPSLSHELRVWEGRRRMLTAATSSKFYGRKPASVAYACQLLSRFF